MRYRFIRFEGDELPPSERPDWAVSGPLQSAARVARAGSPLPPEEKTAPQGPNFTRNSVARIVRKAQAGGIVRAACRI
jgi:hypothetical protein